MESVGIAQLRARLSHYIGRVKSGEEILVCDGGSRWRRSLRSTQWRTLTRSAGVCFVWNAKAAFDLERAPSLMNSLLVPRSLIRTVVF